MFTANCSSVLFIDSRVIQSSFSKQESVIQMQKQLSLNNNQSTTKKSIGFELYDPEEVIDIGRYEKINQQNSQIQSGKIITRKQLISSEGDHFLLGSEEGSYLKILKSLKIMKSVKSMNTSKSLFSNLQKESFVEGMKLKIVHKSSNASVWKIEPYSYGGFIIKKKVYNANKRGTSQLQMLDQLSGHLFIVCLYEAFKISQHDGYCLQLFMQYFQDATLSQRIYMKGAIQLEKVKIYVYQIFRGLHFIHTNKIYHCNLHSQNIFMRGDKLAIGDFGAAKFFNSFANSINVGGYQERAPQLIMGNTQYTQKIDIWAGGCILVEMILGQKLFSSALCQDDVFIEIIKIKEQPTVEQFKALNPNFINILKTGKFLSTISLNNGIKFYNKNFMTNDFTIPKTDYLLYRFQCIHISINRGMKSAFTKQNQSIKLRMIFSFLFLINCLKIHPPQFQNGLKVQLTDR